MNKKPWLCFSMASVLAISGALADTPRIFTLPREQPLRRVDPVPAGAVVERVEFAGKARPGEYFVFQLGVVAGSEALGPLRLIFSDLSSGSHAIPSNQIECLNLGGIGNDGKPFQKDLILPPQRIQPLWSGIHIPESAKGTYLGKARLEAGGKVVGTYSLRIQVEGEPVANHGDDEAANLSRLRWLNSTIGNEPTVTAPFNKVGVSGRSVRVLGRELEVGPDGLPSRITSYFNDANTAVTRSGRPVLSAPFRFVVESEDGPVAWESSPGEMIGSDVEAKWTGTMKADGLRADVRGRLDFAGSGEVTIRLTAERDMDVKDIRLEVPWREEAARYFMGLGKEGGYRSNDRIDWRWDITKRQDCFWMGDVNAGMMLRFKDQNFVRPLVNIYYEFGRLNLPDSWGNGGKGGVTVAPASEEMVPVSAYSGPRTLRAGETLSFICEIHITPFRTLDTEKQWSTRFAHPKASRDPATLGQMVDTMDAKAGPNVLNIHQAHAFAPFINYPYADAYEHGLMELVKKAHAKGCRARIYYTTRELTQNLPELHALHSLNGEVIFPGPGKAARTILHRDGPHPWLIENLGEDFIPAWVDRIDRPEAQWDLSVITTPDSRWNNFYLEGLQRLVERLGFDGVYLDDTALDARSLQRARRIIDRKPGRLLDFHTWNHMNHFAGFANNLTIYMELLPYFDRLWIGEGFSMARPADFILVESSGLPFGLMSEMLDHPNPWRGLIYGQTTRLPWSGDPRPIWKAFDEFGIKGTEFIPYFSERLPVRTGSKEVLASVYRGDGRSWVVMASWANESRDIKLDIDWKALGLDTGKAGIYAPAIAGMQAETLFRPGDVIPVAPGRGWVFILDEEQRKVRTAQEHLAAASEVFRYNFTAPQLSEGWRVHASKHDKMDVACLSSSLVITGAANRFGGVEHDLPPKVRAVELDIDPGTDRGQTWGPGLALVWPNGQTAKINWRAEDREWGIFGAEGFRRAKGPHAVADQYRTVRIMLTPDQVLYQIKDGDHWQTVDTQSRVGREGDPSVVRLGKLGENGSWTDFGGAPGGPGRAAVTDMRVFAE